MNITAINYNFDAVTELASEPRCFNWCLEQNIINYNNLETQYVMVVAAALAFILIYEVCIEYEKLHKYAPYFIYFAKLSLYIFFFAYVFILKMRLFYYV